MKAIKVSSMWCPSCLIMEPIFNDIEKTYNLVWENLDFDLDEEKVAFYQIGKILPVLIFFDNNDQELFRIIGEKSKADIIKKLEDVNK